MFYLFLLNSMSSFENGVDPDQLASNECFSSTRSIYEIAPLDCLDFRS